MLEKVQGKSEMDALSLIVAVVVAFWGIWQTFVTHKLQREIQILSLSLDQSVQRLYRARDAVIQAHKSQVFIIEYSNEIGKDETWYEKYAELSAYKAELRGIAFAIGDEELMRLAREVIDYSDIVEPQIRINSQHLHTRISELLEEALKGHKN